MARYVIVRKQPWVEICDRCGNGIGSPFWWAPSKQARHRCLCEPCHEIVKTIKRMAFEMYRPDPMEAA